MARVRTGSGDVVVKWVRSPRTFAREVRALREFTPLLAGDASQLLDLDETAQVLVVTFLPGDLASSPRWSEQPAVHERAGRLLRRLHESAPPQPLPDYAQQLLKSFDGWAERAAALVDASDLGRARAIAATVADLGPVDGVPAHRDNTERNWLVDDAGHVRLIDFGACDVEPWWVDLQRLEAREWSGRPDLQQAFLAGYGRPIDDRTRHLLRVYRARAAVSTIAWATEHDDLVFADEGRAQLQALLADCR
ncbi:aminoglycoside phosphotransferase family protein [Blastococcus sp. TF02-09]|uniref:aminoglycoside phosphotransferase family protein n=1 Tax=Blastococcus sp. TF02-09 TaxID=2250576 RepID=UPI000DE99EC7|nr:aminoglycoside phosphotransferase family protein [Blastococcus sp. TF02-9]